MIFDASRVKIIHKDRGLVDIIYKKSLFSKEYFRDIPTSSIQHFPEKNMIIVLPTNPASIAPKSVVAPLLEEAEDLKNQKARLEKRIIEKQRRREKKVIETKKKDLKEVTNVMKDINF